MFRHSDKQDSHPGSILAVQQMRGHTLAARCGAAGAAPNSSSQHHRQAGREGGQGRPGQA